MKFTGQVARVMDAEKISALELAYMVEHSAKSSQRGHNRRYHNWLFKVSAAGDVTSMVAVEFKVIGTGGDAMWEEHEACGGRGCHDCGWAGEIVRKINNQLQSIAS